MHDGLGSVRQLLDSTGEVETNYAYDPFGVYALAGDVYNPYQFTGEAWDAEVELLYLRHRRLGGAGEGLKPSLRTQPGTSSGNRV